MKDLIPLKIERFITKELVRARHDKIIYIHMKYLNTQTNLPLHIKLWTMLPQLPSYDTQIYYLLSPPYAYYSRSRHSCG